MCLSLCVAASKRVTRAGFEKWPELSKGIEPLTELSSEGGPQLLFVYGTLMRESGGRWPDSVEGEYCGRGEIGARLYDLGEYPGAVPSDSAGESVKGELYRLRDPQSVLEALDRYEEYFPSRPDRSLFLRTVVPVDVGGGVLKHAWVYLYNGPIDENRRISSGDYRTRRHGPTA